MSNEIIEAYIVATYDDDKGYNIFSLHSSLEEANNVMKAYNNEISKYADISYYYEQGRLITEFLNTEENGRIEVSKCTIEFID